MAVILIADELDEKALILELLSEMFGVIKYIRHEADNKAIVYRIDIPLLSESEEIGIMVVAGETRPIAIINYDSFYELLDVYINLN